MGLLLMLMTIGGLLVAGILFAIAWLNESAWLKRFVLGSVAIWLAFYVVMLIGASLLSTGKLIEVGDADGKAFCGFYLDCHMHTAVTGVRKATSIGERESKGEFYIVTVKVFSDAQAATLGLLTVDAHIVDDANNIYARDVQAEENLGEQPPFERQISPADNFEKRIVFDLPADVQNPRLDVREGYGIDHAIEFVLIGDEDSIFHKRNYFNLADTTLPRASND